MARILITAVLLVAALAGPAQAAAPVKPPKLRATLETCTTSPLPVQRIAAFVGAMPARANAPRMQMRFELERRRDGQRGWRRLKAAGFGVWERADPNVAGFVFTKRVTGLPVPANYRALVLFRWLAADGTTVKRAHARTRACRQPDLRPNLVPGALTGTLDLQQPGLAVYTFVVRNTGRSAAGPFSVRVGGASAEVDGLAAGEERAVAVSGIACAALLPVVVRVDADRRVEESEERGNGTRRQCPLALG
ncbi:MAG TPA: CARDB domain-containing protein [Solirubrobacteraceae bacterium]|nr:CARDB domain-containing protein [Solirubrobacteraceae bacterium]